MANALPRPKHVEQFLENMEEVARLLEIHTKISGAGAGRKHSVEVLNKSAMVLACACWEAYVEDLCDSALEWLATNCKSPAMLPEHLLETIGQKYNGKKAWVLAGEGWRKALRDNLKEYQGKNAKDFNTPKSDNVDALFKKIIGLDNLSGQWRWKGRSSAMSRKALDDFVVLRGDVAHRVRAKRSVLKADVTAFIDLQSRLAVISTNRVGTYLHKIVGAHPWMRASYRGVR